MRPPAPTAPRRRRRQKRFHPRPQRIRHNIAISHDDVYRSDPEGSVRHALGPRQRPKAVVHRCRTVGVPSQRRDPQQRFALFVLRVEDMNATRAFREGTIRSSFNIRLGGTAPSTFDFGDEDDLRSALVAFRRFTAPREDVYFPGIANLVQQHVESERCRSNFRGLRENWNHARGGGSDLVFNGVHLDGFDLVVNGAMFHDDAEKESILRSLPEIMIGMLRTQMANFVIDGSQVLWRARNNLREVLAGRPVLPDPPDPADP
jgi:hypothetical protein